MRKLLVLPEDQRLTSSQAEEMLWLGFRKAGFGELYRGMGQSSTTQTFDNLDVYTCFYIFIHVYTK